MASLTGLLRSRGGWLLLFGLVVPRAVSMVTVLVSAAVLGPDGRGQLAFVLATAAMLAAVSGFALYLPAARTDGPVPRQYLDLTFLLSLAVDAVLVGAALVFGTGLLTPANAVIIALNVLFTALVTFGQRVLQARVSDREFFMIGALPAIASGLVLVALLLAGGGVMAYLWLWTALNALTAAWVLARMFARAEVVVVRPYALGRHLRLAAPAGASLLALSLLTRGDITVLGLVSTESEVGLYSLAVSVSGLLILLGDTFVLRAVSARRELAGQEYADRVVSLGRAAAAVVAIGALPLVAATWVLVEFFLTGFAGAFWPTVVLCVAGLPAVYTRVLQSGTSMAGGSTRLWIFTAGSLVLFGLYVPAAQFGALGLAVASLVVYTVQIPLIGGRRALAAAGAGAQGLTVEQGEALAEALDEEARE